MEIVLDIPKPNLFLIGAPKCGTTFFHDLLSQHPQIFMSEEKELWHFNDPDHEYNVEDYLSSFIDGSDFPYRGESSPAYCEVLAFPDVPSDIHKFSPNAKILYLVREPFSRLRSVWAQTLSTGHWAEEKFYSQKMPLSYREAVFSYPPFLDACRYWTTIEKYREYFEDDNIKVILFENLISDYDATLKEVFEFLSVAEDVDINPDDGKQNKSEGKTIYSPWSARFGRLLPPAVKAMLPQNWKENLKATINTLSVPEIDHSDLSEADVNEVRRILAPEIRELYAYLGIENDPWNFFGTDESAEREAEFPAGLTPPIKTTGAQWDKPAGAA